MITVVSMTGLVTVQDLGRPGYGAMGVARGGAMDAHSMMRANALAGNPPESAALEWALGGGSLQFAQDMTVAIAGAEAEVDANGQPCPMGRPVSVSAGERLTVRRIVRGRFAYVAVLGGIDVPTVLGSRATHLSAGFGGHEGRRLRAGDVLPVGSPHAPDRRAASFAPVVGRSSVIRALDTHYAGAFTEDFRNDFWRSEYIVSPASDRTGYRLAKPGAGRIDTGMTTSEPVCPGTIQLPPGGEPIVLMVEGPTVGGYPKIGVVASVDLGALAQKQPGDTIRFERITLEEAQRLARAEAVAGGRDSS